MALFTFLAFLAFAILVTGCQSPAKITNVTLSLQSIKRTVIATLPHGLREQSLNGRELLSGYFSLKNWEEDATDRNERAYAKVVILESGRPYRIDVNVIREKKVRANTYNKFGVDKKATKELVDKIREALADRREDRNIIDDFRAF